MIKNNIVLVLGAGASKAYGLPIGEELKAKICYELGKQQPLYTKLVEWGHSGAKITKFREALIESHTSSVDAFLTYREDCIENRTLAP